MFVGRSAEMFESKRLQTIEVKCRTDLIVGEEQILLLHRERVLETGKYENGVGSTLADEVPGMLQFAKIVGGAGQNGAARV
ncbi:MAG: hypothetical protein WAO08_05275 [Hyphomicrobiaceae bacterium]